MSQAAELCALYFMGLMSMLEKTVIEWLEEVVAIPSVTPDHGGDPEVLGELRLAQHLDGVFSALGFSCSFQEVEPGRPNLLARLGSGPRSLLIESHMDTVGFAGMTVAPFTLEKKAGKLYGRGSCDTKGPLAAVLWALHRIDLDALQAAGWSILFVGAMGEETGNHGAIHLVAQGCSADWAVVLEPTENQIVYAHKGALWLEATLVGRAAHGSKPEKGCNAIYAAMKLIAQLQNQIELDRTAAVGNPLGLPTLNIGCIDGGQAVNVVPASCSLRIDRRVLAGESSGKIIEQVKAMLEELKTAGHCVDYHLDIIENHAPFATELGSPLIQCLQGAGERCGIDVGTESAGWYSDAGPFSSCCKDVVVIGPGAIEQAHTPDEYIEEAELEAGARLMYEFFQGMI